MKDDKFFEQAIEWLLRMEDPSREDRRELWKWLLSSPRHVLAYLRAKRHLGAMRETFLHRRIDVKAETPVHVRPAKTQQQQQRQQPAWRLAASLAALGVMIATYLFFANDTVQTDAGEWQTKTLADGTIVHAGPRTKFVVAFTDEQRIVRLERGEAMFRVAPNYSRPFVVITDQMSARAVGTAYAVSLLYEEGPLITVEEGTVAVTRRASSSSSPGESVMVRANERVQVTPGSSLYVERDINVRDTLAWVRRSLVFGAHTRVQDAVREFNLRNPVQIEIAEESAISTIRVNGGFRADDPDAFVAFLERRHVASVVRDDSDTLRLVPYREPNP